MTITSIPLGAHLPCYSRDLPRLLCGLLGWSAFSVPWVSLAWVGFVKKRSWQSLRLSHRHLLPLVVATQGLAANLVRDGGCSTTCSKSEALAANPHRLLACRHLLVHLLPAHNRSSPSSLSFILSKSQQQAILAHSLCHSLFLTQQWLTFLSLLTLCFTHSSSLYFSVSQMAEKWPEITFRFYSH